ncbi:Gfo/Idh/MocA family protein [Paenibacillus silvisoli]|uniref:Gfo/Idh/MocA family protein n=1 Tax=Paenibacillus silvisoli TaxID=3110539 RepID=UPI002805AF4A|nr:Gfo/Idh/MocA family oxidoreductase [Paenibacillus silvisoli]
MTIKVGIAGRRGLNYWLGFQSDPRFRVEAFCELDEAVLQEDAAKFGIPRSYRIYEDMLQSDLDAIVVATPMQLHVSQTIAALDAGKHVLCEVTAGVAMDELWWLQESVERSGKVYMMSENACYFPENQIIAGMVRDGLFGEAYFGEGEYLHDIRHLGRLPGGKPSWRSYWQLGKRGAFYPTHSLGPLMKWFEGDAVRSVSTFGSGWHAAPEYRQEDTTLTVCRLESGKLIKLRIDCLSPRPKNAYYSLQGTKGCYEAPRGLGDTHKIWLEGMDASAEQANWRPLSDYMHYLPERYRLATEEQKSAGHWGSDFFIVHDFIQAITAGTKPEIDVYDACEWTAVALLSELSAMNGGKEMTMPKFRKGMPRAEQIIRI